VLHVIPGSVGPETPSIAVSGALQECIQRFISWTARAMLPRIGVRIKGGFEAIPPDDWAAMSVVAAVPGSLTVVAKAELEDPEKRDSVVTALRILKSVAEGRLAREIDPELRSDIGVEGLGLILGLTDMLRTLHLSVSVKWGLGEEEEYAMIGEPVADRIQRRLSDLYDSPDGLLSSGAAASIVVQLTASEAAELRKDVDSQGGGHESLIAALQKQLDGNNVLKLRPDQVERVVRYVQDYGGGGYQNRLRPIYAAIYQYGLSFTGIR
jgi:hypothetical protein